MNQLNAFMAFEIMHDSIERAERDRRAREQPPSHDAREAGGRRRAARPRTVTRPLRRVLAALRRAPAAQRH